MSKVIPKPKKEKRTKNSKAAVQSMVKLTESLFIKVRPGDSCSFPNCYNKVVDTVANQPVCAEHVQPMKDRFGID